MISDSSALSYTNSGSTSHLLTLVASASALSSESLGIAVDKDDEDDLIALDAQQQHQLQQQSQQSQQVASHQLPPHHHHKREPLPMQGGTTFHFVTDGIESALRQAKESAAVKVRSLTAENHIVLR